MSYEISLNQFTRFLNKSGSSKYTMAKNIFKELASEYELSNDYWLKLKNRIKWVLSNSGLAKDLSGIEEEVSEDKRDNYLLMTENLQKMWGDKHFVLSECKSKCWRHGNIRIKAHADMCYKFKGKTNVVLLYFHKKNEDKLVKSQAYIILELMHEALCIDENMILSIWDVARNHKFNYSEKYCEGLDKLLEGEASTLSSLLDSIGRDI